MRGLLPVLEGDVVAAARALLGRTLVSDVDGRRTSVMLTEVEAYGGEDDPASHAVRGPTTRNRSMFGLPGTLYVYRAYGIHWCANVVTGPEGVGSAVLLRAGAPIEGAEVMRRRRGRGDHLTDGPGRLTQALGITGALDGSSLRGGMVRLAGRRVAGTVQATPRKGITRGTERPWRFVLHPRTEVRAPAPFRGDDQIGDPTDSPRR
jgi:DNA-3-methyladenine glycosylase